MVKFKTVQYNDKVKYELEVNELLQEGYTILCTNCGITPSPENWEYFYIATLMKEEVE